MRPALRTAPVIGTAAFGAVEGIIRDRVNVSVGPFGSGDLTDGAAVLAALTIAGRSTFRDPLLYGGLFQLSVRAGREVAHRAGVGGPVLYSTPQGLQAQPRVRTAGFMLPRGSAGGRYEAAPL